MFKKYIKKIILVFVIVALFFGSIFIYVKPKTKADSQLDVYNYMYLVLTQEDSAVYSVRILYDYSTNHTYNNTVKYINLASSEYENFSGTVVIGTIYLGYGYISSDNLILDSPYWCIPLTQYISSTSSSDYTTGFQTAQNYYQNIIVNDYTLNSVVSRDYMAKTQVQEDYFAISYVEANYTLNSDLIPANGWYSYELYNTGIGNAFRRGREYQEELDPHYLDTNFYNFLGQIFKFPGKFLVQAFDVDIMGINVGGLVSGIFFFAVCLGLIGLIRKAF